MTRKTYHGSCQCGSVTFEADIDLDEGTGKCNCTLCWKRRWWSAKIRPDHFRSLTGADLLSDYEPNAGHVQSGFCSRCGVRPYDYIACAEWNDGARISINVACLDDLDPADLVSAPVHIADGLHDNWWNQPTEIRHL